MGDFVGPYRSDGSVRLVTSTPISVVDRIIEGLEIPIMDANERFEEMKKIFENTSRSDAKDLLARMKTKNQKDPLSTKFHETFSELEISQLNDILEARSVPSGAKPQPATPGLTQPGSARKAEVALEGMARRTQLENSYKDDAELFRAEWAGKEASQLDKILPRDPRLFEKFLVDKNMPVDLRAKVLGVMLLRGGSVAPNSAGMEFYRDKIVGRDSARRNETHDMTYQKMAVKAVLSDKGQLFEELSRDDGEHLPTHRRPATQLMYIMLQEGGHRGDPDGQNSVEAWIEHLPSKIAGKAMYHMYDAAKSKEYGGGFKVDGVGVEVGKVGFSLSGRHPDTHWNEVINGISDGVGSVFGKRSPEEKRLIVEGFREAKTSFELTILDKADSANREPE